MTEKRRRNAEYVSETKRTHRLFQHTWLADHISFVRVDSKLQFRTFDAYICLVLTVSCMVRGTCPYAQFIGFGGANNKLSCGHD